MKSFNDIRENTITEAVDYDKLKQLARYGLVDKSNVTKLIAAFKKMEDGKILQPAQRELMLNVLTDLTGIITGDSQMFMKAKKAVSEEVESITELTAEEKRLVNTMYDKKGNLTAVGKKVMDHGKKNRFPHNTSASQGQRMGGKSTMYSEDALIDEKYDTPVKKKPVSMMSKAEKDKNDERRKAYKDYQKSLRKEDTMDEAISGDQYYYVDPKGVVVAVGNKDSMRKMNMKQAKDGNKGGSFSQNRKKYKVGDKINESVIDEARPSQRHPLEGHPYHKKTNAELEYIGKDAHKAAQAMKSHNPSAEGKYLDQANDSATVRHFRKTSGTPDWYKKKYGHSMKEEAQIDEASKEGTIRIVDLSSVHSDNRMGATEKLQKKFKLTPQQARKHMDMFLKEEAQIDEISMTKMAAYAPKAVKSRNDAKAATHSADSNRVANAKKVIAKRKAGADNYNKKMWGYGNVAPTKESVEQDSYEKTKQKTMKTFPNVKHFTKSGHPDWKKHGITNIPTKESIDAKNIDAALVTQRKRLKFDTIMAKQATQHKKEKMARADGAAYRGRTEDTQIDEMGAFMSSPLPTPMSMRKEPSMTKPLMLTKKMNTAATLIKKAGNTPVSPRTEATYSDTGWQKPEVKKDKFGNVIKTKNVAKTLAKSGLRQTKDMAKK